MYLMYNPFRFNDKYLITISKEHEDECHSKFADVFPVIISNYVIVVCTFLERE